MRRNSRKLSLESYSQAHLRRVPGNGASPIAPLVRGKEPLRVRVYSYLRSAILSGNILPEEHLVEEVVARELGVSRTPVREALQKLEREGLLEHFPNRGFLVPRETESQVAGIFEIRAILEGYILRIACENATNGFLSELSLLLKKAERCLGKGRMEELHRLNTMFHDRIMDQVPGRDGLKGHIRDLREHVLRYRSATLLSPGGAERTLKGHAKVILALKLGDPDLCERIMRDHVAGAKDDAIRHLMERKM